MLELMMSCLSFQVIKLPKVAFRRSHVSYLNPFSRQIKVLFFCQSAQVSSDMLLPRHPAVSGSASRGRVRKAPEVHGFYGFLKQLL